MQYFDEELKLPEFLIRSFKCIINEHEFTFKTQAGVFSKSELDEGTYALIKVLLNQDLGKEVFDLGAGIGCLGLPLAYFNPHTQFILGEITTRAAELCNINTELNALTNVKVVVSDRYAKVDRKFTSIITNPPIRAGKEVVYSFFLESLTHLETNGSLYFVMRKSHGAKSAAAYVQSIFNNCTLLKKDKGYYIYRAVKEQ